MTSSRDAIRQEYADRARRLAGTDRYSPFNPAQLFALQQRQRQVLAILRRRGFYPLTGKRVLEVGCGSGGVLGEFLGYGVPPQHLHGADVLADRVAAAHQWLPHLPIICAAGQQLPYAAGSFDLLLQYTMFSSILDAGTRAQVAREMLRVLRRPGGLIIWYDFWWNPTNRQTRGIRPAEIRRLFPGCQWEFHRLTLAPPITRRLAAHTWLACYLLEQLGLLNTHYMVAIQPGRAKGASS